MKLHHGAFVAVVDGETLLLFRNTGDQEPKLAVVDLDAVDGVASGTTGYRSSAANPDNDTQAEDDFAAGVAALLNRRVLDGRIHHLVVVAAPKTLGELRKHWHKALEATLAGEIAKELTGHSAEQIAAAITAA